MMAQSDPAAPQADGAAPSKQSNVKKQAIVVVHGMGEQRPMDTIRSFVESAWIDNDGVTADAKSSGIRDPNAVWSKPDGRSGSLELKRITTRQTRGSPGAFPKGVRCDFYELYWADLTAGTPWEEFTGWLRSLLFRSPAQVPSALFWAWIGLWALTVLFVLMSLWLVGAGKTIPGLEIRIPDTGPWQWLLAPALGGLLGLVHVFITATFARVARYTRATPSNIAARAAVRERGLKLLKTLNADKNYSRIIVVGHSLGSILAYELIAFYWAEQSKARRIPVASPGFDALKRLESSAKHLELLSRKLDAARTTRQALQNRQQMTIVSWFGRKTTKLEAQGETREAEILLREAEQEWSTELDRWREAQFDLRRAIADAPAAQPAERWIITDFVTLGSPLAHAEVLLASDKADLDRRIRERELPSAPPYREALDKMTWKKARRDGLPVARTPTADNRLFCHPDPESETNWMLHHAAPFAVVRWTNIHDPAKLILLQGDLISGPLNPVFGPTVRDIDLTRLRGEPYGFTHTAYWRRREGKAVLALQAALNLLDRPDPDPLHLNPWPIENGRPQNKEPPWYDRT
jgi:hypothetical protein